MAATPDTIPSDLTLEIGDDLSPDEFLALARAFFGYVKEVTAAVTPEGERVDWTVRVKEGSGLIGVDPQPSAPTEIVRTVYVRAAQSIHLLAHGQIESAGLSEPALGHLRALSDFSFGKTRRRDLRLWVQRRPIEFERAIAQTIAEDTRATYSDYGVIEGRLDAIQDTGKLEIRIRDAALRQAVKAYFPEEMLSQAFENFRKRVEVGGIVHYRANGVPISITVAHVDKLPDDSELPTAADVRGLLA